MIEMLESLRREYQGELVEVQKRSFALQGAVAALTHAIEEEKKRQEEAKAAEFRAMVQEEKEAVALTKKQAEAADEMLP